MNCKLIFSLSIFRLAMVIATVYFILLNIVPFLCLIIFIICAWIIAKRCSEKYFLHGLMVSMVNSVWITAAHIILFSTYIGNHPQEATMMEKMPMFASQRMTMAVIGPVVGLVSGII